MNYLSICPFGLLRSVHNATRQILGLVPCPKYCQSSAHASCHLRVCLCVSLSLCLCLCLWAWLVCVCARAGGCELNNSCASDRLKSSPVCAVCEGNRYMSSQRCYSCAADALDNKAFRLSVYMLVPMGVMAFLALILFLNLLVTPSSTKLRLKHKQGGDGDKGKGKEDVETEDVFISAQLIHDMQGSKDVRGEGMSAHTRALPVSGAGSGSGFCRGWAG